MMCSTGMFLLALHLFALQPSRACLCVAVAMARTKTAVKNDPQAQVPRKVRNATYKRTKTKSQTRET